MILSEVLQRTKEHFSSKGIGSAKLDAELLLAEGLGWKRLDIYLKPDYPLNEEELDRCRQMVRRRSQGEPVAYILGFKDFYNIRLHVNPSVLIPRPETELLVDEALAFISKQDPESTYFGMDLGSGSGCLAISLAVERPNIYMLAVEKSVEACEVLRQNVRDNGVADRVFVAACAVGELDQKEVYKDFAKFCGRTEVCFDFVVANPPYIASDDPHLDEEVRRYEPATALFAEQEGLLCYQTWPQSVSAKLQPGAALLFEIGHQQGAEVQAVFSQQPKLTEIRIRKDYAGHDRVLSARYGLTQET